MEKRQAIFELSFKLKHAFASQISVKNYAAGAGGWFLFNCNAKSNYVRMQYTWIV